MDEIFEFILNLLEAIGKTILPDRVKIWYKKQNRRMRVILEAIFDAIMLFMALFCFWGVISLIVLFLSLFGVIGFEG